jgi:hypothetical protein
MADSPRGSLREPQNQEPSPTSPSGGPRVIWHSSSSESDVDECLEVCIPYLGYGGFMALFDLDILM